MLTIYTDGACARNPGGPGGWAFIVTRNGEFLFEACGHMPSTTNNRAELTAVIEGLRHASKVEGEVRVLTDSQYVVNGITKWISGWIRHGWTSSTGWPVKNKDLWEQLHGLTQVKRASFEWVRGHNGDPFNERADLLAVQMCTNGIVRPYTPEGQRLVDRSDDFTRGRRDGLAAAASLVDVFRERCDALLHGTTDPAVLVMAEVRRDALQKAAELIRSAI